MAPAQFCPTARAQGWLQATEGGKPPRGLCRLPYPPAHAQASLALRRGVYEVAVQQHLEWLMEAVVNFVEGHGLARVLVLLAPHVCDARLGLLDAAAWLPTRSLLRS